MLRENRGQPLPDTAGNDLIRQLLDEIREEEELSAALGLDLTPPAPSAEHAPRVYAPLPIWLAWSDEAHAFREAAWRKDRNECREHPRATLPTDGS